MTQEDILNKVISEKHKNNAWHCVRQFDWRDTQSKIGEDRAKLVRYKLGPRQFIKGRERDKKTVARESRVVSKS